VRSATHTWAHASGATLHVIRCRLDGADGRVIEGDPTASQALPERGTALSVVAGLFRGGQHATAGSTQELRAALRAALSEDEAGATRNAALIVDTSGLMGEALAHLAAQTDVLLDFVARPEHKIALLRWAGDKPAVVSPPTRDARAIARALSALRPGQPGDYAKDLDGALAVAQRLPWRSGARPVLVVLSAAPTRGIGGDVLAWTDTANVRLTLIEPLPSLTAPVAPQR
jgi:Mg-chelatase subunit ChlD